MRANSAQGDRFSPPHSHEATLHENDLPLTHPFDGNFTSLFSSLRGFFVLSPFHHGLTPISDALHLWGCWMWVLADYTVVRKTCFFLVCIIFAY